MKKPANFSVIILMVLLLAGCGNGQKPATEVKTASQEDPGLTQDQLVERGEYLVTISGCNDCHSPKKMGEHGPEIISELRLSGHQADQKLPKFDPSLVKRGLILFNEPLTASAGMWGISYSANITSDQTGIGNWTEDNFKRALKEGKFKGLPGSRTLLPPMPWQNFADITDEDVKAIFAYLKSTTPVNNVVPLPVPPDQMK